MSENLEDTIHPGELLREEFLAPMGLSPAELATAIGADPERLVAVIEERAGLDAELGLRLARAFGQDELYWLNVQMRYDVECVRRGAGLERIEVLPQCRAGADES